MSHQLLIDQTNLEAGKPGYLLIEFSQLSLQAQKARRSESLSMDASRCMDT
jgi:hypothetical protein